MKILIVWSGALVPMYRQFFDELSRFMRVRALGPKRWTHGSVTLTATAPADPRDAKDAKDGKGGNPELIPAAFWPRGSSLYLVPSLIFHLWRFRPRYLYLMEEMDRISLFIHALAAKLCWPPVRIACYSLQNLPRPGYYRIHHALALFLNGFLVDKAVAASREAAEVLRHHGYRGPVGTVPLWGSDRVFSPGEARDRAAARKAHGIPDDALLLVFAGSLVEAKGLLLLKEVLPRFPHLRLMAAGQGPLDVTLRQALGSQYIPMGPLEADALVRCYRMGDYVILPSVTMPGWKEQIGRSLIEGVMCGCIALGSDSGYIPELTLFAETTFKQGDAESLAALLGRLPVADADRIKEAQEANVRDRFSAAAAARGTWEFLEAGGPP